MTARQTIEIDKIKVKLTNCVTRFILMLNILVRKVTSLYMGYTYIPYLTKHRSYQVISQSFIYILIPRSCMTKPRSYLLLY